MYRAMTDAAQTAAQGGDGNVMVVATEANAPIPMQSRADARVKSAVKASRISGKMVSIKLSDIFED